MNHDRYFGHKNKFDRDCIDYCYRHPETEESKYFLEMLKVAAANKRAEAKRWKQISTALEAISKGGSK